MKLLRIMATMGCVALISGSVLAQGGLLEKGKGKGNPPPEKSSPPVKQDPPKQQPPVRESPPRQLPPVKQDPPKQQPPVRENPPRQLPPVRNDPPPGQDVLGKGRGNPPVRGDDNGRGAPPVRGNDPKPPIQLGNGQGGQQSGPPLGRIDNTQRGGGSQDVDRSQRSDELLGRRDDSRSGRVQYGTVNNKSVQKADPQAFRVGSSTILDVRSGSLQFQVRREDDVRRVSNYRVGYVQYDSRWCDDYFAYPYYAFTPIYNQCVVSPWYYYPQLPGYVINNRITIIQSRPCTFIGVNYNWSRNSYGNNGNGYGYGYGNRSSDLDYALEDLVSTFERPDRRALDRLVPRRGNVSIALEGRFAYSMDAEDFYDMFLDASQSSRTTRYDILDVRTNRDEATIMARHDYLDPWGRTERVYHYLRLIRERGEYVIREFGTSSNRFAY